MSKYIHHHNGKGKQGLIILYLFQDFYFDLMIAATEHEVFGKEIWGYFL